MNSSEESEIEKIAEQLHQVHIDRHRLYEMEQHLIKKLIETRNKKKSGSKQLQLGSFQTSENSNATIYGATEESSEPKKTDRFGKELKVGDHVEFLTSGQLVGRIWKIYKLTEKRVLCERNKGEHKTHREYKNVKKIE